MHCGDLLLKDPRMVGRARTPEHVLPRFSARIKKLHVWWVVNPLKHAIQSNRGVNSIIKKIEDESLFILNRYTVC